MKHIYITTMAMVFAMIPAVAETHSGTCGDNAVWTLDNHTLRISGSGATTNYVSPGNINATFPEWYDYKDEIHHVIVEDGITSIGDFSFYKYHYIESVSLPEGLTRIGNWTFADCTSLKGIILPETTETIGDPLLNYNNNGFSFYGCHSLEEITLPAGLKMISGGSFNDCDMLTKVNWNAIDCEADAFDPVARYTGIFASTPVNSVTFGKDVISIPAHAFRDVESLSEITTPGTISYVGYMAFNRTGWERMQELEKVIYVDKAAYVYKKDKQASGSLEITIAPGTKSITDHLFDGIERLEKITIPETVDRIGNKSFIGCTALSTVEWNPVEIQPVEGYEGSKLFSTALTSIKFGDNVRALPDNFLFGCTSLPEIALPASLETIGENAFEKCDALTTLTIPGGVKTLGRLALYSCANLEKVTIGKGLETFDYYFFLGGCPKLTTLEWNAVRTQSKTLDLYHGTDRCSAPVENFIVGDDVEYVPGQLFYKSETLSNVVLGKSVREIGSGAFRQCTALTDIKLPESLVTIGDNAFYKSGLQHIVIPENVTLMDTWSFGGAALKQAIIIPLDAPQSSTPFTSHSSELKLYVPDVDGYRASSFASYGNLLEPMATPDKTSFTQDEQAAVNFTCNIPDYTMNVISMPSLEQETGEHTAIVEAEFTGEETFNARLVYRYEIKPSAGIHTETASQPQRGDVYTPDGILVAEDIDINIPLAVPAGIYIIKTGNTSVKRIVR